MSYQFNNFYELITFQAKKRGSKVALLVDDEKITYGDILEKVDKLAGYLATKGVKEGDKVALFLRNSPEFIYTIFAASKLGAILVPVNTVS
jgi:acyl-CoA synthetase (AMP-forming)/AMP-acid ligase II